MRPHGVRGTLAAAVLLIALDALTIASAETPRPGLTTEQARLRKRGRAHPQVAPVPKAVPPVPAEDNGMRPEPRVVITTTRNEYWLLWCERIAPLSGKGC